MSSRLLLWPSLTAALACCAVVLGARNACGSESLATVIDANQPKMVKIYGAGGLAGLEPYQSGFLISAEGHIATVWSYVLDTDYVTATLSDGRRFEAKLVGADPRLELAVLKIEADELPYFELGAAVPAEAGSRVLAFSNLFGVATGDEPASVQHGIVAVKTRLDARRGVFESPYRGPVYVLDAMTNNPGAAGGALLNQHGELLAMLGKELRRRRTTSGSTMRFRSTNCEARSTRSWRGSFAPRRSSRTCCPRTRWISPRWVWCSCRTFSNARRLTWIGCGPVRRRSKRESSRTI